MLLKPFHCLRSPLIFGGLPHGFLVLCHCCKKETKRFLKRFAPDNWVSTDGGQQYSYLAEKEAPRLFRQIRILYIPFKFFELSNNTNEFFLIDRRSVVRNDISKDAQCG